MALRTHASTLGVADRGQHPRDRPHLPAGQPAHRLPDPAQQGDRRGQRLRARVRHPPARRADGADHLRAHGPGRAGLRRVADRARQALGPPRRGRRPPQAGLRPGPRGAGQGLHPVQGAGRPQAPHHRRRPGGAGRRRGPGRRRRLPVRRAPGGRRDGDVADGHRAAQPRRRGGGGVGHRRRHGRRRLCRHRQGGRGRRQAGRVPRVGGHRRHRRPRGRDRAGGVRGRPGNRARRGHRRGRGLGARLPAGREQALPQHRTEDVPA